METLPQEGETLFELLAAQARRTSDGRLALSVAIGLVGVSAILLLHPSWWRLVLPLISVAAFGAWGMLDRMAQDRPMASDTPTRRAPWIVVAEWSVAALGLLAAVLFGLVMLALLFVGWIH
jgi:hypothetical protein